MKDILYTTLLICHNCRMAERGNFEPVMVRNTVYYLLDNGYESNLVGKIVGEDGWGNWIYNCGTCANERDKEYLIQNVLIPLLEKYKNKLLNQ